MPKLLYFPLQGRAQAIRYMLKLKGIDFEDQRLTGAEWGPIKAAATYGANVQMPIYVKDDNTHMTQSMAILKSLAMEHGYMPTTAQEFYEAEWFLDTATDMLAKPGVVGALLNDDATEEQQQVAADAITGLMDKYNTRFSDDRAHVAGATLTYADFQCLATYTSVIDNAHVKHQKIKDATTAKKADCANLMRVVDAIKGQCQATVDALQPSSL